MTPQCHTGGGEACCVWDAELPWNMDVLGLLPDSRPQAISLTLAQQALLLPNCSNILLAESASQHWLLAFRFI